MWCKKVGEILMEKPCMEGGILCAGILILTDKGNIVHCGESVIDRNATADNTKITSFNL
jgi:hypothetical protein